MNTSGNFFGCVKAPHCISHIPEHIDPENLSFYIKCTVGLPLQTQKCQQCLREKLGSYLFVDISIILQVP